MTWGPFTNNGEFQEWYQRRVGSKLGTVLFAVFANDLEKMGAEDDEGEGKFADIIGLEHTYAVYATTELGLVRCSARLFLLFYFLRCFYRKRFLKEECEKKN